MDDDKIIKLYLAKSEKAIAETDAKYGKLCRYIAMNILHNSEDSEECVNDVYHAVWNAIPPKKPEKFSAFIGKITRNLALKKYEFITAAKRNPEVQVSLSELDECVSGHDYIETELENRRIERAISDFLRQQSTEKRTVFIRRYWYIDSISCISKQLGISESKVTSMLFQTRRKLREFLESEDIKI